MLILLFIFVHQVLGNYKCSLLPPSENVVGISDISQAECAARCDSSSYSVYSTGTDIENKPRGCVKDDGACSFYEGPLTKTLSLRSSIYDTTKADCANSITFPLTATKNFKSWMRTYYTGEVKAGTLFNVDLTYTYYLKCLMPDSYDATLISILEEKDEYNSQTEARKTELLSCIRSFVYDSSQFGSRDYFFNPDNLPNPFCGDDSGTTIIPLWEQLFDPMAEASIVTDCGGKCLCDVECEANKFDTNENAEDGCETGCPVVVGGTCDTCSNKDTCTAVTCDANKFDTNGPADGCETGCPVVVGGTCYTCSNKDTCTAVTCDANNFDTNGPADGCETGCPEVVGGTCDACSDATTCTAVTCDANKFDTNGPADGCKTGCPVVVGGTCDACSNKDTCTAVTCDVNNFDTNSNAADGCETSCPVTDGGVQVELTFELSDSFGDGWEGGLLTVIQNGMVISTLTLENGRFGTEYLCVNSAEVVTLGWTGGSYIDECSYKVLASNVQMLVVDTIIPAKTYYCFDEVCCDGYIHDSACVDSCPAGIVHSNRVCDEECPAGKHSNSDNSECKDCSVGEYSLAGSTSCRDLSVLEPGDYRRRLNDGANC